MQGILPNFTVPFIITLMAIAALQPTARYIGLVDRPGGRKSHDGEVPLIGGLSMLAGLMLAGLVAAFVPSLPPMSINSSLVVGALFLGLVGAIDDRFDLPPALRLVAQGLAGFAAIAGGTVVHSLGNYSGSEVALGILAVPFTLLTFMAFTNAFNWQDGSDGIAGGQALIVFASLLIVESASGSTAHSHLIVALIGCVVAFLVFNAPFAQKVGSYRLFMGDAGALFLGFALAWFAIVMSQGPDAVIAPVTALWFGAVPVIVAAAVAPLVTVPTASVFAGPAAPVAPWGPAGPWPPETETPTFCSLAVTEIGLTDRPRRFLELRFSSRRPGRPTRRGARRCRPPGRPFAARKGTG